MSGRHNNWPFVLNLGNSIIGVSILATPYCFKECGILLGSLLLLCSAYLTRVSCNLLLKTAFAARKRSYEFLALHTFGAAGKLAVEISIIGLLLGTCVAFYVIIGDLGPAIIAEMTGLENTASLRAGLLVFVAIVIVTPLGMMRDITSFTAVSTISLLFYSVFIVEVLMWAIPNLVSGSWIQRVEMWRPAGIFKCLPIFSMAFACQTQLFVLYGALDEPSVKRMNNIVQDAINMVGSIYLCVGFFGYVAFCELVKGDVLLNFSSTFMAEVVKMGFCLSVAVSFPLMIFPCRQSIDTLFFRKHVPTLENIPTGGNYIPPLRFKAITMSIIIFSLITGIVIPNIETVLALTGATTGVLICFIFPSLMFLNVFSAQSSGKITAQIALFVGVSVLVASTYTTLTTPGEAPDVQVKPIVDNVPDFAVRNVIGGVDKNDAVESLQSLGGGSDKDDDDRGGGQEKDGEEHHKDNVQVDVPAVKEGKGKDDQEVQVDKPGEKDEEEEEKDKDREKQGEDKDKDDSRLEPPIPHEPKEPKKDMDDVQPDNEDSREQWEQHHKDEDENKDTDQEGAGKDPDDEDERELEDFEDKEDDKESAKKHEKQVDMEEAQDKHDVDEEDNMKEAEVAKEYVKKEHEDKDHEDKEQEDKERKDEDHEGKDKKEHKDKEHREKEEEDEEEKDEGQKKQLLDIIQKQQEQQEKLLEVQQQLLDELKEHKAKDTVDEDQQRQDGDHVRVPQQAAGGVMPQQAAGGVILQQAAGGVMQQQAAGGVVLQKGADIQQQAGLVDVGLNQPVVDLQQKGIGDVLQQGHVVDMALQQQLAGGQLHQDVVPKLHQPVNPALQPIALGDSLQHGNLQQGGLGDLGQQQGNVMDGGANNHEVMVNNAALEVAELHQGILANAGMQQEIADNVGIQAGHLVDGNLKQAAAMDGMKMNQGKAADGQVKLAKQAVDPHPDIGGQIDQGVANNVKLPDQDMAMQQRLDVDMHLNPVDSKKVVEKQVRGLDPDIHDAQEGLPDANPVHHRVERAVGDMEIVEVPRDGLLPAADQLQVQGNQQDSVKDAINAEGHNLNSNNDARLVKKEVPEEVKEAAVNMNQLNRDLKYHVPIKPVEALESNKGHDESKAREKILQNLPGESVVHDEVEGMKEEKMKFKEVKEEGKDEKWDFNNYKKEENLPVDGNNNVDMVVDAGSLQKDLVGQAEGPNLVNLAQVRDLKAHPDKKNDNDHRKEFRK
ncbi:PREDICTED: putative sodium-coupled neutral amino acid transporter 10 isoform X2 [Branchiostoma belcheri]|uniref:Sodium-coupled neutral amino acid transporter 10 isoform X2 n=1 Tax=Branchiostoma belcheri TaxID=7741 RepID=A0A6P4ZR00_BRABE|nr:PREDICTED: putative sodium-coupled neutral amino acid transporter 10 isoform X2 [Branchiostoma belcheri]